MWCPTTPPRWSAHPSPSASPKRLGLPPEPFVLAVLFGANMSYVTPMSYQTNLLVMSAGNYRFAEFVKVGAPLTVLMLVALTWALAEIYF